MNLRDFHTVTANYEFDLRQNINKNKVKIVINRQSETPIYMNLTNGKYIKHENDKFNNMYYIEEEKKRNGGRRKFNRTWKIRNRIGTK